ncbi:Peroxisome biogenesis protein 2 [Sesamum angolense]|uniref:RING-type E3 ubiquitin transferase (cysteine targeting) n=1 Tax=Sesamum angolense TaxID=2727404 RepID=A0AAE1XEP7_9LAMI|nr:Peroxisome biogenesis protein 2 [Sesamum angolense]
MDRQTLASSSSSTSGTSANPPPPEDAWYTTYLKLLNGFPPLAGYTRLFLCFNCFFAFGILVFLGIKMGKYTDLRWRRSLWLCELGPVTGVRTLVLLVTIPIDISRVNQIDAARLDIEMSAMLKEQLVKVFSLMKECYFNMKLDAFLEFLIWRFSIWVDKPTPGNALMNLRYRDEHAVEARGKVRTGLEGPGLTISQKVWYCIATVGGQYIWARLQSFSAFRRWGDTEQRSLARRSWFLLQRIEGFYKAASFGNLLVFLLTGRYRSLIERALRARLVYGSPNMNRSVSFEYMNRQLVWNEFSEMLLLLLPLLNSSSVKNFLRPFSKDKSSNSEGDDALCPICRATPTTPFLALPCQHSHEIPHLYVSRICLRRCSATMAFRCSRCNEPVVAMQRYGGPVNNHTPPVFVRPRDLE